MESENFELSFSGCGFLGIYHVGVASAIKEYVPEIMRTSRMAGCSAGALVAAALMCDCCLGQATTDTLKLVIMARSTPLGPLRPSFSLVNLLRDAFDEMLPANAHEICSNRLFISLTRFTDGRNVLVSQYESKTELIQALLCSAFIPFYCGTVPPTLRGVRYIDGGLSLNQPVIPARIDGKSSYPITVSPWSGESDICPADDDSASWLGIEMSKTSFRFTARNLYRLTVALFPPHPEVMSKMCRQGFEDSLRFLTRNGLISCARCLAVRSSIQLPNDPESSSVVEPATFNLADDDEDDQDVDSYKPQAKAQIRHHEAKPTDDMITPLNTNLLGRSKTIAATVDIERRRANNRSFARLHQAADMTGSLVHNSSHQESTVPGGNFLFNHFRCHSKWDRHRHSTLHDTDLDDTCESCVEVMEYAPKKGLPPKITKKFVEATTPDSGLISYLTRTPAYRLLKYMMLPYALPIEFIYTCCIKILEWLPSIADDARWLVDRIGTGFRMVLQAIEQQRHVYSARFSCQLAITEFNIASTVPTTAPGVGTYYDQTEARFGISADLTGSSRQPLRKQFHEYLIESKRGSIDAALPMRDPFEESKRIADATVNLQWEALKQSNENRDSNEVPQQQADDDTVAAIVEYTRRHEALMAYYYLDDKDGQIRVTEIFGMDADNHNHNDSQPNHHNGRLSWRRSLTRSRHASNGRRSNASGNSLPSDVKTLPVCGEQATEPSCSYYAPEPVLAGSSTCVGAAAARQATNSVSFAADEPRRSRNKCSPQLNPLIADDSVASVNPKTLQASSYNVSRSQHSDESDEADDRETFFVPRSKSRCVYRNLSVGYEAENED